jgi:hypothetical protein
MEASRECANLAGDGSETTMNSLLCMHHEVMDVNKIQGADQESLPLY